MKFSAHLLAAVAICCSGPGTLTAAPPPAAPAPAATTPPLATNQLEMQDLLTAGDKAFQQSDWALASAKLSLYALSAEKLGITEKLDIIYYIIGISNFQLKQWTPTIDFLKKYEDKYPKGEFIRDVQILVGKALGLSGDFKGAASQFEKIRNFPEIKDQVMPLLAEAYERSDQGAEAVKVLDEYLKGGYNSTDRINAALRLASLYLTVGDVEKGVDVLDKIKNSPSSADFVIIINAKALETAKNLVDTKPETAIIALQAIRRKSEVLRLQTARNEILKGKIAEWARLRALSPTAAAGARYQSLVEEGKDRLKQLEQLQETVEKDDSYDAVVLYNLGRCFDKLGRNWESELAFRTIVANYKTFANASSAMFGQVISMVNLKRTEEALTLCKTFLKEYPKTTEAPILAELAVTMLMEKQDFEPARNLAKEIIAAHSENPSVNKLILLIIGCDFSLYAFKDARAECEGYRTLFPNDAFKEEIDYRYALTFFFENDYKNTLALLGKYVTDYPNGVYKTDARYRLGIVLYGEQQAEKTKNGKNIKDYESHFRNVIADVRNTIEQDPNSAVSGELYALLGDCYDQMTAKEVEALGIDREKESADAYMQGALKAAPENQEVLDYCMEQARTKLQATDRWKDIRILYEDFVKTRPKHPDRLKGIYWVCKAMSREAKTPEEKAAATEKVKAYLSKEILSNINRANTEGVEMLIEQLAQNCIPKRKPRALKPVADPTNPGAVVAPPPPAAPEEDPFIAGSRELDKFLGSASGKLNATGEARLAYAKIQLLKMLPPKIDPADPKKRIDRAPEVDKIMDDFGQNSNPDNLSATMLAFLGDHLRKKGVLEKAMQCYNRLAQVFPKSDYVDFAYVGLGDIAFEQKDFPQAEKHYSKARDEMPGMKYPNALLGVAKAQFSQNNFTGPEKPLQEIVGTKEWKGELTAEALYWLGKCAFAQKDFAKAANYFQRIFLSFGKFNDWCIKGYVEAAECFKAMGEPDKAKQHLQEARDFLKKRKLEGSPLMQQVKDQATNLKLSLD